MIFYSGFALKDDDRFFESYLDESDYCVAGFSYGAIKAFEYVQDSYKRVDKLQLFSPAFFQGKKERYIAMQLGAFSSDEKAYLRTFVDNCFYPAPNDNSATLDSADYHDLKRLLTYIWDEKALAKLKERGIKLEVYLGADDKIIDAQKAFDFFTPYAEVTLIKDAGHFLIRK